MPKINSYNLIDEPWIPIVGIGLASLKQVFSNQEFKELGGNPIQKIALTKMLLAIAQAAYTPKDEDEWRALGAKGMADKCLAYLQKWYGAFWLYGNNSFLQMPAIHIAEKQDFGVVFPEIATGNTTVFSQSQKAKPLTDADKALMIVTLMGFGLGGKKTDNKVVLSEGYQKKAGSKPGTHLGYLGYLHSFIMSNNLLTSLWINLFTETLIDKQNYPNGIGLPPWEQMPTGENCTTAQVLTKSFIGRLVPLSRFCLIDGDSLHYSDGIYHLSCKEGGRDPSIAINITAKETKAVWCDPQKRPWRWLTSLLECIKTTSPSWDCRQLRLALGRVRNENISDKIILWSGGLKVSGNAGEQYTTGYDGFVDSKLILDNNWLGEEWFEKLKVEMDFLVEISNSLRGAVLKYFNELKYKKNKQCDKAFQMFWQLAEMNFQNLALACESKELEEVSKTRHEFRTIAHNMFNLFCPKETARQLAAWAKHRPKFNNFISKIQGKHEH